MTAVRVAVTGAASGGGGRVSQGAFGGNCSVRIQGRVVFVEGRTVGANDLCLVAHIEKHMRMIERRFGADAHEFVRADLDLHETGVIVKVRNHVIRHVQPICQRTCPFGP